jgi:hypothetical protein
MNEKFTFNWTIKDFIIVKASTFLINRVKLFDNYISSLYKFMEPKNLYRVIKYSNYAFGNAK